MRHRLKRRVFDCQKLEDKTPSTLTKKTLHSKSTYFYRWCSGAKLSTKFSYIVPSVCTLALLFGGIVAISPGASQVFADEVVLQAEEGSSISLAFDGTPSFIQDNVKANEVAYISNSFTVTASRHSNLTIQLSAMNGSGTELHGKDNYGAVIAGVGSNVLPTSFGDNTWGYAIAPTDANPDKTTLAYSSVPSYTEQNKTIRTDDLSGGVNEQKSYLLAFAAKISSNSPSDHYIGNYLLSVIGDKFDPEPFTLSYNLDGGTGTTPPFKSCQLATTNDMTCNVVLEINTTPTRDGYTFLGWGDSQNGSVNAAYTNNAIVALSGDKTIWAIWQANAFSGITRMDQMTSTICSNAKVGEEASLIDDRDGVTRKYFVTKLADNNCWMTQNLAYNGPGTAKCTVSGTTCSGWPSSGTPSIFAIGSHTDSDHTSKGNYYSYDAAQAACPTKWQLPTSGSNTSSKSFVYLLTQYGVQSSPSGTGKDGKSYTITGAPLHFQYGGDLLGGGLFDTSYGFYWSSTPDGASDAYHFYFDNSDVNPSSYNGSSRYIGYSVRCVAK